MIAISCRVLFCEGVASGKRDEDSIYMYIYMYIYICIYICIFLYICARAQSREVGTNM